MEFMYLFTYFASLFIIFTSTAEAVCLNETRCNRNCLMRGFLGGECSGTDEEVLQHCHCFYHGRTCNFEAEGDELTKTSCNTSSSKAKGEWERCMKVCIEKDFPGGYCKGQKKKGHCACQQVVENCKSSERLVSQCLDCDYPGNFFGDV